MFKKLVLFLIIVIAVFSIIVNQQPSDFHVERSAVINVPAPIIFEQLNDLHKWNEWSPWAKIDPNAKAVYEGPQSGVGAVFIWSSENNEVGEGRMTIRESRPSEFVGYDLEFIKPMEGKNTADFTLEEKSNQTRVTWRMAGEKNFIMKAVGLFMNCDEMVGAMFEKGLGNLKAIAESNHRS